MPRYLVIFVLAWVIAQGAKYILEIRKEKSAKFKRIITESGGMPSSHSSVVIAIATLIGLREGIYSPIFGLAFVFAMIVIYDSMKVRFSNGVQAERINEIIESQNLNIKKVRVVKGHTPLEVAVGSTIGIFIGYIAFLLGL
jgi:acid phosphatase/vanadium-dependent haloperoxidase related protein